MTGYVLAAIGIVLVVLAVLHHFVLGSFLPLPHLALILGVVGAVAIVCGVVVRQIDAGAK